MSQKTMLVVNPVSGKTKAKTVLLNVIASLGKGGNGITVFVTEKRGDATGFAEKHARDFDRIICIGGDGTINEIMNGLMRLPPEERKPIGYVPLGSTNDMASTFGIPGNLEAALNILETSEDHPIDIGQIGDEYFGYVAAFGAFSEVSFSTPQEVKNALGYPAYILGAIGSIGNITPYHVKVEYDDGVIEDDILFGAVVNSTSVAGFMKLRPDDVAVNDGKHEIVLIKKPVSLSELSDIAAGVIEKKYNANDRVRLLHTSKAKFTFDKDAVWTRDGENGGLHREVTISNCHSAIRMIFPANAAKVKTDGGLNGD